MKRVLMNALVGIACTFLAVANGQQEQGGKNDGSSRVKWGKNVELQVPARAGGGTDLMARSLSSQIAKNSNTVITVVNNTDGNGIVAMEKVRTSKPDGNTLLLYHSGMLIKSATGMYKHTVLDDFTLIGVAHSVEKATYVLVVSSDSPYKNVDSFVAAAKKSPGTLLFGVEMGGASHIMSGLFALSTGIKLKNVSAGSDTEKLTALVGKNIDACFVNTNQANQYVQAGKVRPLAVVSLDDQGGRSAVLPEVPSFIELGYKFSFCIYTFVLGPKGMAQELVDQLRTYFTNAAQDPAVNKTLIPAGLAMEFYNQKVAASVISDQQKAIDGVAQDLGLTAK